MTTEPILPETAPTFTDIADFPIDELPPDSTLIGDDPTPEFTRTVQAVGVMEPIIVKIRAGSDVRADRGAAIMEISAGRRRLKAARKCGLTVVPIRAYEDGTMSSESVAIIENIARRPNMASELSALKRLIDDGHSTESLAKTLGIPFQSLSKRVRLLGIYPPLLDMVFAGKIKPTVANLLVTLTRVQQERLVANVSASYGAGAERVKVVDIKGVREVDRKQDQQSFFDMAASGAVGESTGAHVAAPDDDEPVIGFPIAGDSIKTSDNQGPYIVDAVGDRYTGNHRGADVDAYDVMLKRRKGDGSFSSPFEKRGLWIGADGVVHWELGSDDTVMIVDPSPMRSTASRTRVAPEPRPHMQQLRAVVDDIKNATTAAKRADVIKRIESIMETIGQ